jgi:type II secretory pathway pseudopilin PulG
LVELLVVIGIIATLISILLPALNRARGEAKRAKCLSNLRQLTMAWAMYADEHHGRLVSSDTVDATTWVLGGDGLATIKQGALYQYVNQPAIYLCPNDTVHYFRTYSINGYLQSAWGYPQHAHKITDVRYPTSTFVFIEEYDARGYNEDSFAIGVYPNQTWVDYPAPWHEHSGMLSFVDGHAEAWPWKDPRTSTIPGHFAPGTGDLPQLQAWLGFGPYPPGYAP